MLKQYGFILVKMGDGCKHKNHRSVYGKWGAIPRVRFDRTVIPLLKV